MLRPASYLLCLAAFMLLTSAETPPKYVVGDQALDFSLQNVDGRTIALSQVNAANGYIIVFTCNHCPYAQLYEQRIINLHKKFAPKGFPVIAINPNSPEVVPEDNFEAMQQRAAEKRYPFLYLCDSEQTVSLQFGATRTPQVFVLDKDRYVRYIGAIDDNAESASNVHYRYVENAVYALLNGEMPELDYTRAVGCTIKKKPGAKN
jgi:peroxiredoxin